MKKLIAFLALFIAFQVSQAQTPFPTGIRLSQATETATADSIPIIDANGIINKWMPANLLGRSLQETTSVGNETTNNMIGRNSSYLSLSDGESTSVTRNSSIDIRRTDTTTGSFVGINNYLTKTAGSSSSSAYDYRNYMIYDSPNTLGSLRGSYNKVEKKGSGNVTSWVAGEYMEVVDNGSGNLTGLSGHDIAVIVKDNGASNTISNTLAVRGVVRNESNEKTVNNTQVAYFEIENYNSGGATFNNAAVLTLDIDSGAGTNFTGELSYLNIDSGITGNLDADVKAIRSLVPYDSYFNGGIDAGRLGINNEYSLPTTDGTAGQVMTTDGAGTLTWSDAGSGGGSGSTDYISFMGMVDKQLYVEAAGDAYYGTIDFSDFVNYTGTPLAGEIPIYSAEDEITHSQWFTFDEPYRILGIGGEDTTFGQLYLYGDQYQSGTASLRLYNNAGVDDDVDYWRIHAMTTGDLNIGNGLRVDDATLAAYLPFNSVANINTLGGNAAVSKDYCDQNHQLQGYTVANLPANPGIGTLAYVTDGNPPTYRDGVTGGGSDVILVFYDGTRWIAH